MSDLWKQARVKLSFVNPGLCHSALLHLSSYRKLAWWNESLLNSDVNTCPQSISKTLISGLSEAYHLLCMLQFAKLVAEVSISHCG